MGIATAVYQRYVASGGYSRRAWSLARLVLIKLLRDPTCSMPIHGRRLKFPLSHSLPDYLKQFRFYDRLPHRISDYIHQREGHLNCIDVGANIGDTIAAFCKKDTDTFLAIEPNPKFHKLLGENWDWNKNVTVISDICSSGSSEDTFIIQEKNGTASIFQANSGIKMRRRSLDEIVNDHPFAANANVLKIDTDGHDFEVLAGAEGLISRNHPIVLFECDVFNNANYAEDCLSTLRIFERSGYRYFLLYDNFGSLMGRYSFSNLSPFRSLLFYQLTSSFYYFDILVMNDEDMFHFYQAEIDYFTNSMPEKSPQRTAAGNLHSFISS
jgi:FkbM family methyltransferase